MAEHEDEADAACCQGIDTGRNERLTDTATLGVRHHRQWREEARRHPDLVTLHGGVREQHVADGAAFDLGQKADDRLGCRVVQQGRDKLGLVGAAKRGGLDREHRGAVIGPGGPDSHGLLLDRLSMLSGAPREQGITPLTPS